MKILILTLFLCIPALLDAAPERLLFQGRTINADGQYQVQICHWEDGKRQKSKLYTIGSNIFDYNIEVFYEAHTRPAYSAPAGSYIDRSYLVLKHLKTKEEIHLYFRQALDLKK